MIEVSVVLPAFNAESTIGRAVHSILDQTFRNLELIVLDDGSTDETANVVRGIDDPRLTLAQRDHCGVTAAANWLTEAATAPLIARMDADDFAHPQRLEKQIDLLNAGSFDVVGCQVRILDQVGVPLRSMERYAQWINDETLSANRISELRFVEFPLVNPTLLARRQYFEMGFRDGAFPEDYDLMLRAAARGMRFGKVPEVLFDWHDHAAGLTRRDSRYTRESFDRCRRMHLLSGPLAGVSRVDLWGVGQTGKPWLRWLQSENIEVRHGYDVADRKVGQTIHGVRIQHPSALRPSDTTPIVIAVGAAGARSQIRPQLEAKGYVPGEGAWFVS